MSLSNKENIKIPIQQRVMVIGKGIYRDQKLNQKFTIITYCFAGFFLCVIVD